jgi:hypothetical protein
MGTTMRNIGRVGLILVLAVLADGTTVLAQGYAYYNRIRSDRQEPGPLASQGIRVARSGSSTAVARTARRTEERLPSRTEQEVRVARSEMNATVAATVNQTDTLHPYTAEFIARAQVPRSEVPAGSTWEQQPRQPESTPQPQVVRSQPRDYYPNMRTGMTPQPLVTLTANRNFYYPGCHCTPSRAQALGGGGHHR